MKPLSISRRDFLRSSVISAAALTVSSCLPEASYRSKTGDGGRRPNILFCISDDQSWAHTSIAGCRGVNTPNFDRVASMGVMFEHAFCNAPACAPSRAAILTGRPMWANGELACHFAGFPREHKTFPELLEDNGYMVGSTGKGWGPGRIDGWDRNPAGRGWNKKRKEAARGISNVDYAENFFDFLSAKSEDEPFFFWYGAFEPHRGYKQGIGLEQGKRIEDIDVPAFLPDTDEIRSDVLDYFVEIEWFDSHLGRMLSKLEEMGELENTLIVVTSDNGMPFPRAKSTLYDHGSRMPLAVWWPGHVDQGRVVTDFVMLAEFAPTFLEAAGVARPASMMYSSLLGLLESGRSGRVDKKRSYVVLGKERHAWCNPAPSIAPMRAIRTDEWLYIRNLRPDVWPAGHPDGQYCYNFQPFGDVDPCPSKEILIEGKDSDEMKGFFKLAFGKRGVEELYDVRKDPGQINNLAGKAKYAGVKAKLRKKLEGHLKKTGDPRMNGGGEVFDESPYYYSQGLGTGGMDPVKWGKLSEAKKEAALKKSRERVRVVEVD